MSLPTPPTPYSEGGQPQSQIAPGERTSELIHEVRNLATAVTLLNQTYLKKEDFDRRSRWLYSAMAAFLAALVGTVIALIVLQHDNHINHIHEDMLVQRLTASCENRNQSSNATTGLINGLLGINSEQVQHISHPTALQRHIEAEYISLLKTYEAKQPAPINCQNLKR